MNTAAVASLPLPYLSTVVNGEGKTNSPAKKTIKNVPVPTIKNNQQTIAGSRVTSQCRTYCSYGGGYRNGSLSPLISPAVLIHGEHGAERGEELEGRDKDRSAAVQAHVLEDRVRVVEDAGLTGHLG